MLVSDPKEDCEEFETHAHLAEPFSNGLILDVLWKNEDELSEDITKEDYNYIFKSSKVDIVRLFPYVVIGGKEYYLKMKN